jgi:large subunit ribosomal protein L24
MRIKKGDTVIIVTGKDKGKSGKVVHALPKRDLVVVEGINIKKKHQRPRKSNQKGQIVERAMPVQVSNVMLADPKSHKPTRIGIEHKEGKRIRVARKSNTAIA